MNGLLALVVASMLPIHSVQLDAHRQQALAKRLGAKVQRFEMWTDERGNVTGLILINHQALTESIGLKPGITDADLAKLVQFPELSAVNIECQPISDRGLQVLQEFPNLKQVGFHYMAKSEGAAATPDFIASINKLRDLEIIEIKHNFGMKSINIQSLEGPFPKVWRLVLDTPIDAEQAMRMIQLCPNLTDLQLHRIDVSGAQLTEIGERLPKLQVLWLKPKAGVSCEHLAALEAFPRLRIFSPQSFRQGLPFESGWEALLSLPELSRIELSESHRSQNAAAIEHLQTKRPKLQIDSRLTRSRNYKGL